MNMTIQIQNCDPCGCSYTWGYDAAAGRTIEVRIPCMQHTAAQPPQQAG